MSDWLGKLLPAVAPGGLLAGPAPAAAPPAQAKGGGFNETTEKSANAIIADIFRRFKKEVYVEAYNKPPADRAADWAKNKHEKAFRERFFRQWAEERFRATGANGIFVLVYRESPRGYFIRV